MRWRIFAHPNAISKNVYSVAVARLRVFTQPRPIATLCSRQMPQRESFTQPPRTRIWSIAAPAGRRASRLEDAINVAGPAPNSILASRQGAFSFSRTSQIWKGFTSVTARSRRGHTEKRPRSKPSEEARFDQGRLALASTAVPKVQQPSRTVVIFDECELTWLKL
jgi:hypothetical protein